MDKVEKIWKKDGWKVEDVSMIKGGCDFKFSKNNKIVFCEVKGTTTNGDSVILTSREVDKMKECYRLSCIGIFDLVFLIFLIITYSSS